MKRKTIKRYGLVYIIFLTIFVYTVIKTSSLSVRHKAYSFMKEGLEFINSLKTSVKVNSNYPRIGLYSRYAILCELDNRKILMQYNS